MWIQIRIRNTGFRERDMMLFPTLKRQDFVLFLDAKYGLDRPDMQ
jgi:hypothetical protein